MTNKINHAYAVSHIRQQRFLVETFLENHPTPEEILEFLGQTQYRLDLIRKAMEGKVRFIGCPRFTQGL